MECDQRLSYPRVFWEEIVRALRGGRLRDGSPISWTRWAEVCRYPNEQLFVDGLCGDCGCAVQLPIKWIHDPHAPVDTPRCSDVGRRCEARPLTLPSSQTSHSSACASHRIRPLALWNPPFLAGA